MPETLDQLCDSGRSRAARGSLAEFMKASWREVEGHRKLWWNWHIPAMCEHLEAVIAGEIKRLIITVPPGTSKSRIGCVFWPAHSWVLNPALRFMFIANSTGFASRDSMACRRLVESKWYQQTFAPPWKLREDQNQKTWYQTTDHGDRQSYGVGSNITGQKADIIVLDDPLDVHDAQNESNRTTVIDKFENSIRDRLINEIEGAIVLIGHRTHEKDLTNHLLGTGEFYELLLPEEYDPKRATLSPLGYKADPRTKAGEFLRPRQYGPEQAARDKKINPLMYETKRNQKPRSAEGIRFKLKWFQKRWTWDADQTHILLIDEHGTTIRRIHSVDGFIHRFGVADGASSIKTTADYTVISTWGLTERNELLWLGCLRQQLEIPDQPDILKAEYDRQRMDFCGVEGVASNVALLQYTSRMNMVIRPLSPGAKDKLARATPAMILAETGRIFLPDLEAAYQEGFPLQDVLDELTGFTGNDKIDDHDDIVDTFSYAVEMFNLVPDDDGGDSAPSGVGAPLPQSFNPFRR